MVTEWRTNETEAVMTVSSRRALSTMARQAAWGGDTALIAITIIR